ncbi:protein of unknown function [Maridesulfovibrio hydrothermalis AM13 = DSM 14728]|uniref:Uncharacterized protein n=1 Tax=Maridesulfovibrio hydrothermalis AM13 = DSM 14728 TaxID=1121451 RepID=L0R9D2_9BACT|nr:protein of unknown function [Maridesulfovibrio hydrothermalis AM13 = DSM 14728]
MFSALIYLVDDMLFVLRFDFRKSY